MIKPPTQNNAKTAVRTLVEATAQYHWIPAALATVFRFTHPSEMERTLESWRAEVSDGVNGHEERIVALEHILAPRLEIGEIAVAVGLWLAVSSQDGLSSPVMFEVVAEAFPEIAEADLHEAIFELQHLHFVTIVGAIGRSIVIVMPTVDLFVVFDCAAVGSDPVTDAATLAEMILLDEALANIPKLDQACGWSGRKLNPAVAFLMQFFPEGRYSREAQAKYVTTYLLITPDERFKLKHFVKEVQRYQMPKR
jgi:hypothetical protein